MRVLRRITVILLVLTTILFFARMAYVKFFQDHVPPVITMDSDTLTVSVNYTEKDLLAGMKASDDRDGDLTGKIMIKGVTPLITENTARVTYLVTDSSNNMTGATRTLQYTDYRRPAFSLKEPLSYRMGQSIDLTSRLKATDVLDGDLTQSIRVTAQNVNANYPGVYHITVQVTNQLGDTDVVTLPVSIGSDLRTVTLSDYLIYKEKGSSFDPRSLIRSAQSETGEALDLSRVAVSGKADTSSPGSYDISYTCDRQTVFATVVVR